MVKLRLLQNELTLADDQGSFVVTGPGDSSVSRYATGQVQMVEGEAEAVWHPGDPIAEPTGVFKRADGRLVLSQDCE